MKLEPCSHLLAPRSFPRISKNLGTETGRLMTISPPGFEAFFEEVGGRGQSPVKELLELAQKFGLEPS